MIKVLKGEIGTNSGNEQREFFISQIDPYQIEQINGKILIHLLQEKVQSV